MPAPRVALEHPAGRPVFEFQWLGLEANPKVAGQREFVRNAIGLVIAVDGFAMQELREVAEFALPTVEETVGVAQETAAPFGQIRASWPGSSETGAPRCGGAVATSFDV